MWRSVPQIPVLCDADQDVVDPDLGLGHVLEPDPGLGAALTSAFTAENPTLAHRRLASVQADAFQLIASRQRALDDREDAHGDRRDDHRPRGRSRSSGRTRRSARRSCSSTASGSCRAAGTAGPRVFEDAGYTALTPGWPDDPETVEEANAHPEVFAHKSVGQVADHFEEVIRRARQEARRSSATRSAACSTQILAGRGLSAASVAIDPAPFRGVLPLPISALKSASPVLGNPANRNRAVPLTYDQFRYGFANAVSEDEAKELYETYAVPGPGDAALPGRHREPQPLDRGEGRQQEPRSRPAPDHLRRAGPHRAVGDRERVVQAAEAQRGRHGDRRDARPRATR